MEASSAIALAQWSAIAIALGGNVLVNNLQHNKSVAATRVV